MIKYHDNNIEPQYGEDHKLLDNWDANKKYNDNEYCHVFFRIDTPSYRRQGIGFNDEKESLTFYKEVQNVMRSIGWELEEKPGNMADIIKGKCSLYIHPDSLSGDVRKADVKIIAETLENNNLFTIRWVDIYSDCYDITKEEQIAHLETRKMEIRKMLFERCKTPRRNKYYYASDVFSKIGHKFELDRLGNHFRSYYCYGETLEYINKIAEELADEGYVKLWNDERHLYIRSLNKTELKAAKLKEIA